MRRLGEYELLKKIGSGGMAEVWMGRRAALAGASKVVAIKLLARDVLDDPAYRAMFLDEARLSMLLTNSNVVQVFDVGEVGDECYMVMEWVDGLNLSQLAHKMKGDGDRLSTVAASHIIGEVLRALAYAHGLHHEGAKSTIVHRDVSPQNVLVSVSGEVKLADFGVARLAREETSGLHVKGKLRYMAPEQLRGRSREPTVDLYAVGAIFHELLSGERFRTTRDEADLYSAVLNGSYEPLGPEVPSALVALVAGLLEPDPKRRIASADAALEQLYMWAGNRNSSLELGRLIQKWSGVSGPRSGFLTSELVAAAQASAMSAAQTLPANTRPQVPESQPAPRSGPQPESNATASDDPPAREEPATEVELAPARVEGPSSTTETHTAVEAVPATTILEAPVPVDVPARGGSVPTMLMVAALTLALAFGVFGIGFPLGWWGGAKGEVVVVEATEAGDAGSEAPETEGADDSETGGLTGTGAEGTETGVLTGTGAEGTETETEDTETETEDTETETEGTETETKGTETETKGTETETKGTETKETGGVVRPPPPKKLKPATVKFLLGDYTFAYVQVDGKTLALQPLRSVNLKPGKRFTVKVRLEEADPWVRFGSLKDLDPGGSYTVRLRKPSDLEVEKL